MFSNRIDLSKEAEKRLVRRCVPPQLVSTSVLDTDVAVFGTLSNICNFGACLASDAPLFPGRDVHVLIGFDFLPKAFQTPGRVLWTRSVSEEFFHHGVRFTRLDDSRRETLRVILGSREFQERPSSARTSDAFSNFLQDLAPELDALGRSLGQ